ncbi:hypothetical protein HJ01_00095 [Flavobacterium frigoris PS1]|uniref:Uncharacterized protein n=1 Tax=Flavobacterium frigoris (strain PS1) TaxID=1086011 RepID=H7FLP7_FLAFP|nr:hypothetical protein HJ01_00095 [Flavobacterium frigoris PS1]
MVEISVTFETKASNNIRVSYTQFYFWQGLELVVLLNF